MKTSIALVAAVVALAGCNTHGSQSTAKAPAQPPAPAAPSEHSSDLSVAQGSPSYGTSTGSAVSGAASGSQSGSSQSTSGSETGTSSRSTLDTPLPSSDGLRGLDDAGSGTSTGSQRGSILTEDGVKAPLPSTSETTPNAPRMNQSAADDASRSTQLPGSPAPIEASPSADDDDLSRIPAKDGDAAAAAGADSEHAASQTAIGDEATLGETDTDRALVQRIRQEVVNDETLSSSARSVRIESSNNQVILTGTVGSDREKAQIGSTAFRASGGKQVLNQLDVVK
jgi:osmotically-inducible protein OsmY